MKKFNCQLKGFTLVELLVVIAIIMLLAAILFPVFERARERAQVSSCTSNVKQLAMAIIQYTQDYDEQLPHYGNPARINSSGVAYLTGAGDVGRSEKAYAFFGWGGTPTAGPLNFGTVTDDDALWQQERGVNPYIKSMDVMMCPTWGYKRLNWGQNDSGSPGNAGQFMGNSYAINARLVFPDGWKDGRDQNGITGFGFTANASKSINLSQVIHPAHTGLVADGYMAFGAATNGVATQATRFHHFNGTDTTGYSGGTVQGVLVTYGFVDGHAKAMNPLSYRRGHVQDGGRISWMDDRFRDRDVHGSGDAALVGTTIVPWEAGKEPPNNYAGRR